MEADLLAELTASALTALIGPRIPVREPAGAEPDTAGLYALHAGADAWDQLGLGAPPANAALFVGKAAALSRELELLRTGRTGGFALRRTLAALLREPLALRGLPRSQTRPEPIAEFALAEDHEATLSAWIAEHLELAVWPKPAACPNLGEIEVAVLKRWGPPLNLRDTRSTWGARVSATLKVMASDARTWAREHGHKL